MNNECSICLLTIDKDNSCITSCNHNFCYDCLNKWLEKKTCPNCRKQIDYFHYKNEINRLIYINTTVNRAITTNDINLVLGNRTIIHKNLLTLLKSLSISSIVFLSSTIYLLIDGNIYN